MEKGDKISLAELNKGDLFAYGKKNTVGLVIAGHTEHDVVDGVFIRFDYDMLCLNSLRIMQRDEIGLYKIVTYLGNFSTDIKKLKKLLNEESQ